MTTIAVSRETQEMLKGVGNKGETYDDVINKLYELSKRQLFYEKQYKILDEEGFVPLGKI